MGAISNWYSCIFVMKYFFQLQQQQQQIQLQQQLHQQHSVMGYSTVGEQQFGGQYSASESLQYWAANHHSNHHNQQQMRPSISPSTGNGSTLLLPDNGATSPHSSPLMSGDYASYANYNSTQWEIY